MSLPLAIMLTIALLAAAWLAWPFVKRARIVDPEPVEGDVPNVPAPLTVIWSDGTTSEWEG